MAQLLRPSKGVLGTVPSPIPQGAQWASMYNPTPTRPLLNLSQGVPGTAPEQILQDAIMASSASDAWGYCIAEGECVLREGVAGEMRRIYREGSVDADVNAEDVAITAGCNMAFVAAVMALADNGDEVILPIPWYFNHQMTLTLLGITPVLLQTSAEDGFFPSVAKCKSLINSRTKAIALVTPNNPTGAFYPPSLLLDFFALAKEHNIALIIDETYRDFITSGPPHALFSSSTDWRTTLIHLCSFSKSYRIPGYRLGALVAAPSLLKEINKVLDCLQICAPHAPQLALGPLLPELRNSIREMAEQLEKRHALFRKELPSAWKVGAAAAGGYYAFVRHPFVNVGAGVVAKRLAVELGVVGLPEGFFKDGDANDGKWIRFSVANVDDEKIVAACKRLKEAEESFGWQVDANN
ncbi:PLP-dependent transferase [Armillaria luteobubalina]|uniref:PLP-dependent transferase n=1 Tax=Armillaria luteobubalina TaxID=153913 RepID=A0AA39Q3E9_9AGAR|nr:PLP-dependent transferase [Armillaria luteobubalina]